MTTNPTDPSLAAPERLTVRTPEDALAVVPVLLGFEPRESVVMMTFGGGEAFHARVDLPPPGDVAGLDTIVDQLVDPALAHRVAGVLLVVYAADPGWAEAAELAATARFCDAQLIVHAVVRCDGSHWWAPGWPGHAQMPAPGLPHDAAAHRFRAESVLRGQVVHRSREELAALLDPVPDAVAAVRAARRRGRTVDAAGVAALVGRGVTVGRLDDDDLVALLRGLHRTAGRDAAWQGLTRPDAEAHMRFWVDVVQRSPADLVTAPAAVLALAAWVAGHGALAWCAVDRCRAIDPRHTLAALVADLLAQAVAPSRWERLRVERGLAPGGVH